MRAAFLSVALTRATAMLGPGLALVVVLAMSAPAAAQSDAAVAQLGVRLSALEEQIASLQGELETSLFRQQQLERTIGDLRLRLDQLEGGGVGTATSPVTAAPASRPTGQTATGSRPAITDPEAAASFELGMAAIQDGRFDQGRSSLLRYAEANPDEPRAAEASYWAAETLYVQQDFPGAASAFARNYRTYGPNALRAPDTLLKLGMSLRAMGDTGKACLTLDELDTRHPNLPSSLRAAASRERDRAGCS